MAPTAQTAPTPADMTPVRMRHPEIEHPEDKPLPVTTVHAFENVWSKKGWELVDEPVTGVDLENMTINELRDAYPTVVEGLPSDARKGDIIAAIRATQEG